MAPTEPDRNPWDDFMTLREELELYKPLLLQRESILIANKMDLPEAESNLKKFKKKLMKDEQLQHMRVFPISSLGNQDLHSLKEHFRDILESQLKEPEQREFAAVDMSDQYEKLFDDENDPYDDDSTGDYDWKE
eukprot:TRINITY_DN913_c0_g1_i1.p1 TRINITY_DN913_c0_g1~~TRINITY_DN913_c0_g1_i1.p1  ORF type:complete len:134 (-),score=36.65 TRINITY_DN913_c0_g1_i1:100-501(-)